MCFSAFMLSLLMADRVLRSESRIEILQSSFAEHRKQIDDQGLTINDLLEKLDKLSRRVAACETSIATSVSVLRVALAVNVASFI